METTNEYYKCKNDTEHYLSKLVYMDYDQFKNQDIKTKLIAFLEKYVAYINTTKPPIPTQLKRYVTKTKIGRGFFKKSIYKLTPTHKTDKLETLGENLRIGGLLKVENFKFFIGWYDGETVKRIRDNYLAVYSKIYSQIPEPPSLANLNVIADSVSDTTYGVWAPWAPPDRAECETTLQKALDAMHDLSLVALSKSTGNSQGKLEKSTESWLEVLNPGDRTPFRRIRGQHTVLGPLLDALINAWTVLEVPESINRSCESPETLI